MHTHTSGVSFCSEVSPVNFVRAYCSLEDVNSVVLTNHYSIQYMAKYALRWDDQIEIYLNEYRVAAKLGKKVGLNVILGAEVAIATPTNPYVEFLLYGATENFFYSYPKLYDCNQKQLYKICNANNVLMYQSHPFRKEQGHSPQDPEFMDGTEINCHPHFLKNEDRVREFAAKHNLGLVCGSDFHFLHQANSAATYCSGSIKDGKDLAAFLRANKRPDIVYK